MTKGIVLVLSAIVCWCTTIFTGSAQEVRISYYDGTVFEVSDFSFYSYHKDVTGGYIKHTTDKIRPLIVNTGRLWQEVKGKDVSSIMLEPDTSKTSYAVHIELKGGTIVDGTVPLRPRQTWESGDYFWVQGTTTKFGQPANFKTGISDIASIATTLGNPKAYRIRTKKGSDKTVQSLAFGLYGKMPYAYPSIYARQVKLRSEDLTFEVSIKDIQSFVFGDMGKTTLTMKDGETDLITFVDVGRIFGRLKTGEILFENISSRNGPRIKSIEFLNSKKQSK